mmetsp:Transcript_3972/g.5786  ORF Transcript_3972/g.5786 Transcript_3972/m.5786 type:complete len:456 (-) Transcript_3972:2448-3815(-)
MSFRKLWGVPILTADWDTEYEEKEADWWELFVDLLIVAAATNVADTLKEDLSWSGLLQFVTIFSLFFSGLNFYTTYTTRFLDTSMVHSLCLFGYLYGTATMIVNASGFDYAYSFASGMLMQRVSVIMMFGTVYTTLPSTRMFCLVISGIVSTSVLILSIVLYLDDPELLNRALMVLAVTENAWSLVTVFLNCLPAKALVPLNIDHQADRSGCLVMVILGESVVSCTINFHSLTEEERTHAYYQAMGLSLLVSYLLGMLYFTAKPPRVMHAIRRARYTGVLFVISHCVLANALLLMGVGTKFIMDAVLSEKDVSRPIISIEKVWLFFGSLTTSLVSVMFIRALHFWGRHPSPLDPPQIRRIKYVWWAVNFILTFVPLVVCYVCSVRYPGGVSAFSILYVSLVCLISFEILETTISHVLDSLGDGIIPKHMQEQVQLEETEKKNLLSIDTSIGSYGT